MVSVAKSVELVVHQAMRRVTDEPEHSLDELRDIAKVEHREVLASLSSALAHAIRGGEALLFAKDQIADGEFGRFVKTIGINRATANAYMRIAYYQDALPGDRDMSVNSATRHLRSLPRRGESGWRKADPSDVEEAKRLRSTGKTYKEIGEILGVSKNTALVWCDPAARAKQRAWTKANTQERRRAVRLLRKQERDHAIRNAARTSDKDLAECYSLVRRLCQTIDKAAENASEQEVRRVLRGEKSALQRAHEAEAKIVKALGVDPRPGGVGNRHAAENTSPSSASTSAKSPA